MDKAPDAFRTISEVAEELDIPQHVLRFWETRFAQIKPMKRSGGRRYYRPDDVDLLKGIRRLLYGEGYTIRGVQRILKEHGIKSVQGLADQTPPSRSARSRRRSVSACRSPRRTSAAPIVDRRCRGRRGLRDRREGDRLPLRRYRRGRHLLPFGKAQARRARRTPTANAWNGCCRIWSPAARLLDQRAEGRLRRRRNWLGCRRNKAVRAPCARALIAANGTASERGAARLAH